MAMSFQIYGYEFSDWYCISHALWLISSRSPPLCSYIMERPLFATPINMAALIPSCTFYVVINVVVAIIITRMSAQCMKRLHCKIQKDGRPIILESVLHSFLWSRWYWAVVLIKDPLSITLKFVSVLTVLVEIAAGCDSWDGCCWQDWTHQLVLVWVSSLIGGEGWCQGVSRMGLEWMPE